MTVTLTGDNYFLISSELKKYTNSFKQNFGDLGLEQIDCSESDLAKVTEALTSLPFLSSKKLVILRNPSTNTNVAAALPKLIEEIPESTDLIIFEGQIDKRTSLYKFLKSNTDYKEFKELDPNSVLTWVMSRAKGQGGTISNYDARYLVERVGSNQERLSNEIDKLLLYDSVITKNSIELLTEASPNSSIFDLLEAAFNGNHKKVINLYDEQRQLKVEPGQIMSMITWQLHILMIVKAAGSTASDSIAKDAGLNPFVVRKSLSITSKLTLQRISQLIDRLLKLDVASKTNSLDLDDGLTHYLLSI